MSLPHTDVGSSGCEEYLHRYLVLRHASVCTHAYAHHAVYFKLDLHAAAAGTMADLEAAASDYISKWRRNLYGLQPQAS